MELVTLKESAPILGYSLIQGVEEFDVTDEQWLRIKVGPSDVTLLNEGPDDGKVWHVTVRVWIREEDAT